VGLNRFDCYTTLPTGAKSSSAQTKVLQSSKETNSIGKREDLVDEFWILSCRNQWLKTFCSLINSLKISIDCRELKLTTTARNVYLYVFSERNFLLAMNLLSGNIKAPPGSNGFRKKESYLQ